MCTIGAVTALDPAGQRRTFLFKTQDTIPDTPVVHGFGGTASGRSWLNYTTGRQAGTSCGLNDAGLGVVVSYSDYRYTPVNDYVAEVDRHRSRMPGAHTLANTIILGTCSTVEEAVRFMERYVPEHPDMRGANHIFIDAAGGIAVIEHCEGRLYVEDCSSKGYAGRGNNSMFLIKEKQLALPWTTDPFARYELVSQFTKRLHTDICRGVSEAELLGVIQMFLASHNGDEHQVGQVCVHDFHVPGARVNGSYPISTVTAIILAGQLQTMYYTVGSPCRAEWHQLKLAQACP